MEEERSIHPILVNDGSMEEGAIRSKRDAPPAHYSFKIESFSQLSEFLHKAVLEKYETLDFEVGGYKWKLSLYPKGDEKRNGSDHISLYLVFSETNNLPLGSEVNAFFRLFAYDQIRDKYLMVQDIYKKQTRFHAMNTERGFSQLLPLVTFNDASNGYLVDDCCIFGVEVFVTKCTGEGESVSIKKPQETISHTMDKFSALGFKEDNSSPVSISGHKWYLTVYPCGIDYKGKYLSMYLTLDSELSPKQKVWVDFKLRIKNQVGGPHFQSTLHQWFSAPYCKSWGMPECILLRDLNYKSNGYMVDDTVIVEAEFTQVVTVKDF